MAAWCLRLSPKRSRTSLSPFLATARKPAASATSSDLIDGIYRLMMSNYDLPVNIGNPNEMTILECAHRC